MALVRCQEERHAEGAEGLWLPAVALPCMGNGMGGRPMGGMGGGCDMGGVGVGMAAGGGMGGAGGSMAAGGLT